MIIEILKYYKIVIVKKHLLMLAILIIGLASCKCHKNHYNKTDILEQKAIKKFTDNYTKVSNKTNEFVLVSKSSKEITQSIPDLVFFIFSNIEQSIIYSDSLEAGDIYWSDKYEVVATERNQKAESTRHQYKYNVKLKKVILD